MPARYFVPWEFLRTCGTWRIPSSRQTSAAPASSPKRMISASGWTRCQLRRALRWITAICPAKGFGVVKKVITAHAPQIPSFPDGAWRHCSSLIQPVTPRRIPAAQRLEHVLAQTERLAQRPRLIEKRVPEAGPNEGAHGPVNAPDAPLRGSQPIATIRLHTRGGQTKRRILDGVQAAPAAGEAEVFLRGIIAPHAGHALRVIGIVVVLVHRTDDLGNVDDGDARGPGLPDQPLVPPVAADNQIGDLRIKAAAKGEIVDVVIEALKALPPGALHDGFLPAGLGKIERQSDVHIPAPPDHQKGRAAGRKSRDGSQEIAGQNDVAIDVAEDVVARDLLGAAENGAQTLRAILPTLDRGFVAQTQFAADLRGARIVAEENHLHVRMQPLPAFQRIALDHRGVPGERFGGSEERNHDGAISELCGTRAPTRSS